MCACKGICEKLKAPKPHTGMGRYESGQKRCQTCAVFIEYNQLRCPCCGRKLRSTSRSTKLGKMKARYISQKRYE